MRLVDDQFNSLLAALTPIVTTLSEHTSELARLEENKANLTGEINIEGEVDGVPAEISGLYEIIDAPPVSVPTPTSARLPKPRFIGTIHPTNELPPPTAFRKPRSWRTT